MTRSEIIRANSRVIRAKVRNLPRWHRLKYYESLQFGVLGAIRPAVDAALDNMAQRAVEHQP